MGHPSPNACFRGLAATLGMAHEWIIVAGATANEDLTVAPDKLAAMAGRACGGGEGVFAEPARAVPTSGEEL